MAGEEIFLPESVKEGIYQDIKKVIKYVAKPVVQPIRKKWQRQRDLQSFSSDLVKHHHSITNFIDYFAWHEDDTDWQKGNGVLNATTYGELLNLWTNVNLFVTYEARLLRFKNRGGEIQRVFVIGGELVDPIRLWAFQRTLIRHKELEFSPRVISILDLRAEVKRMGINCDMFGTLNGSIAYFFKFPLVKDPIMLRTIDKKIVRKAEFCFSKFWEKAEDFEKWYQRQKTKLPKELLNQVSIDCETVRNVSKR